MVSERLGRLTTESRRSYKGVTSTRIVVVGDTDEEHVWFEIADRDAEDHNLLYTIPIEHSEYTDEQVEKLQSLSASPRDEYEITVICETDKPIKWRLVSLQPL